MRKALQSKATVMIGVAVLGFAVGILVGILCSQNIQIDSKFTVDGIVAALATLIAVLAATIVLPLTIQPLIQQQSGINSVAHEDIKELLSLINKVTGACEEINRENRTITTRDRKHIISLHTQIHSLSRILKDQANTVPALNSFTNDAYEPLNNSHTDFADQVTVGRKITDDRYLSIRSSLDPVTTKLRELRYKIN